MKHLLLYALVATAEVELFRRDCAECTPDALCEDLLVKTQRDIRQLEHPHVREGTY